VDWKAVRRFVRRRFSREETVGLYFTLSFLSCAALVVAFGVLAHEVMEAGPQQAFDVLVGGFLAGARSQGLTRVMRAVTFLGDWRFLIPGTGAVVAGFLMRKHRVSAILFGGSVVGGMGLCSTLKISFARARPELWPALVQETTYSFPSGHSTMATVFFGGLVAVVFHLSPRRRDRILAVAVGAIVVLGVATSRVYLGAHWATDTFAGVMVGLFWVSVYTAGTELLVRPLGRLTSRKPRSPGASRAG